MHHSSLFNSHSTHIITQMHSLLFPRLQLSLHEQFATYMETTMQLATNQGAVLPPRSSAAMNVLAQV